MVPLVSLFSGFAQVLITHPGMLIMHCSKRNNVVRHTPPRPVHERDSGTINGSSGVPLFGLCPRVSYTTRNADSASCEAE